MTFFDAPHKQVIDLFRAAAIQPGQGEVSITMKKANKLTNEMKSGIMNPCADTFRSQMATLILYSLLLAVLLFLCKRFRPSSPSISEADRTTIKDVSGQPFYNGQPLDCLLLAADTDRKVDVALEALRRVAVPDLLKDLKGSQKKMPAALALMRMGPAARTALPELLQMLQKKQCDRQTVLLTVIILGYIGPEAAPALPALLALARTDSGDSYRPAIHTLGRIGAQAQPAIPLLYEALDGADDFTRTQAAEALSRIERRWEPLLPTLLAMRDRGDVASGVLARSRLNDIEAECTLRTRTHREGPRLSQGLRFSIHN